MTQKPMSRRELFHVVRRLRDRGFTVSEISKELINTRFDDVHNAYRVTELGFEVIDAWINPDSAIKLKPKDIGPLTQAKAISKFEFLRQWARIKDRR